MTSDNGVRDLGKLVQVYCTECQCGLNHSFSGFPKAAMAWNTRGDRQEEMTRTTIFRRFLCWLKNAGPTPGHG
jgi:hypothetical protein